MGSTILLWAGHELRAYSWVELGWLYRRIAGRDDAARHPGCAHLCRLDKLRSQRKSLDSILDHRPLAECRDGTEHDAGQLSSKICLADGFGRLFSQLPRTERVVYTRICLYHPRLWSFQVQGAVWYYHGRGVAAAHGSLHRSRLSVQQGRALHRPAAYSGAQSRADDSAGCPSGRVCYPIPRDQRAGIRHIN